MKQHRLWLCFRGDPVGNWRWADGFYVFEASDGSLKLTSTTDDAIRITRAELEDYVR